MTKLFEVKDKKNGDDNKDILEVKIEQYGYDKEDTLVSLDLSLYTNAFYNKDSAPESYSEIRKLLESKLVESSANYYWMRIMDNLPKEQKLEIESSPAADIMSAHFVEILKNCIDETLQAHHADRNRPPIMEMKISINNNDEFVYIDICDNGRGYPKSFLDKVQPSTKSLISSSREKYILSSQGKADLKKIDEHASDSKNYDGPELTGGRGLGMRYFLADAQNDQLVGAGFHKKIEHVYPKSDNYQLNFRNADGSDIKFSGAEIHLITPIAPRETIANLNMQFKQREKDILNTPSADSTTDDESSKRTTPSLETEELFLNLSFDSEETDNTDEDSESFGFSPQKKI